MKGGKVSATSPKDVGPTDVSVEMAVEWMAERGAKGGKGKRKKAS